MRTRTRKGKEFDDEIRRREYQRYVRTAREVKRRKRVDKGKDDEEKVRSLCIRIRPKDMDSDNLELEEWSGGQGDRRDKK